MNNGVKAEKENTPNEANLQEEEVLSGSVRWRVRPGTLTAPAFSKVRAAGRERLAGCGHWSRGAAVQGWELPQTLVPGDCIFGECVFVGACLALRNFEDFSETFVSIMLSFVCPRF